MYFSQNPAMLIYSESRPSPTPGSHVHRRLEAGSCVLGLKRLFSSHVT